MLRCMCPRAGGAAGAAGAGAMTARGRFLAMGDAFSMETLYHEGWT